MFRRERRVLLRHYREQRIPKAEIARRVGVSRGRLPLDRDGPAGPGARRRAGAVRYGPRRRVPSKAGSVQADHRRATGHVPEALGAPAVPGGAGVGLRGELQPGQAVRAPTASARGARAGAAARDAAGAAGAGGLRGVCPAVGQAAPAGGGAGVLADAVAPVLRAADDGDGGSGSGGGVRVLRGRALGAALRPDAAVVVGDCRREGGRLLENREFLRFDAHRGFCIRACRAGRAQTKGKVERPIRYVRSSFFYGREFVSDDDLNARIHRWLDTVAKVRVRGTLMERPVAHCEDRAATAPAPGASALPLGGRRTSRVIRRRPLGLRVQQENCYC